MKRLNTLLLLALPVLLAACGSATDSQPPAEGNALRETINQETLGYNNCITDAAASIAIKGRMAPTVADEAFAACREKREALLADVLKFRRIGHPSEPEANARLTADQSVLNLEADIRENILVKITQRKLAEETGNHAAN